MKVAKSGYCNSWRHVPLELTHCHHTFACRMPCAVPELGMGPWLTNPRLLLFDTLNTLKEQLKTEQCVCTCAVPARTVDLSNECILHRPCKISAGFNTDDLLWRHF